MVLEPLLRLTPEQLLSKPRNWPIQLAAFFQSELLADDDL